MAASLQNRINDFWRWFAGFTTRLPSDNPPEQMLDELLDRLHRIDERVYFELSTTEMPYELVLTAQGDKGAFPIVEAITRSVPESLHWTITPLKAPQGFDFTLRHNDFAFQATSLWFLPLYDSSNPHSFGLRIGIPEVDRLFRKQEIDVAYTILETGLGERSCAEDIQYVEVVDLPPDPRSEGYLLLSELADLIGLRKARHLVGQSSDKVNWSPAKRPKKAR